MPTMSEKIKRKLIRIDRTSGYPLPKQLQHGAVPTDRADTTCAAGAGNGRACFDVIATAGTRDEDRDIHRPQQRDVVGTIPQTHRAEMRALRAAEPSD